MTDSWCNMHDDILDTTSTDFLNKEMLNTTNIHLTNIDDSIESSQKSFLKSKKSLGLTESKQLSMGEILQLNFENDEITEIQLLNYQTYVSSQLKKYMMTCIENTEIFDIQLHLPKLEWLAQTTFYLSKKRLLKEIKFKQETNHIQRNSYQFCNLGFKCINKNTRCKKKHIVYNYVNCDLNELIKHLKFKKNVSQKEIFTSINTINYVLIHMQEELINSLNDENK